MIEVEQLRAQYRNLPVVLIGSLAAASITAVPFVGEVPGWRGTLWLGIMLAAVAARWFLALRPLLRTIDAGDGPPGLRSIVIGALAGGCAWGSAGVVLFVDHNVSLQEWLAVWLAGMGVSSIPAYSAHLRVDVTYLIPSLVPFVATLYHGAFKCKSEVPNFVDNGDGTVTHNVTGLMWGNKSLAGAGDVHDVNNAYTWSAASPFRDPDGTLYTNFLASLNRDATEDLGRTCFAGHCGWRLPNVVELRTIVEQNVPGCGRGTPCIDPVLGPAQSAKYFSSTSSPLNPVGAWGFGFDSGNEGLLFKGGSFFARAVRGGR